MTKLTKALINKHYQIGDAIAKKDEDLAILLLKQIKNPNFRIHGETALHFATQNGLLRVVKQLLKKGAMIDCYGLNPLTPKDYAKMYQRPNIHLLLEICEIAHKYFDEDSARKKALLIFDRLENFIDIVDKNYLSHVTNLFLTVLKMKISICEKKDDTSQDVKQTD